MIGSKLLSTLKKISTYVYLASDLQLYILGLILCVVITNSTLRKVTLSILFLAGLVIPALQTYFQDLDGTLFLTIETSRNFFIKDDTFNYVYKRGHANLAACIIGLSCGYLCYHWQKTGIDIKYIKKLRILFWLVIPGGAGLILLGYVFFLDAPRAPIFARVLYATFVKPLFGLGVAILILGLVFKVDSVYRNILEWRIWTPFCRVSYAAYLLHVTVIRTYVGTQSSLIDTGIFNMMLSFIGVVAISYICAIPLWLFVEAPINQLINRCVGKKKKQLNENKRGAVIEVTIGEQKDSKISEHL